MGKQFILVSQYNKIEGEYYGFRFYGAYKGKLIKKIKVRSSIRLDKDEIYILSVEVHNIEGFVIYGEVKKSKTLEDYTWV